MAHIGDLVPKTGIYTEPGVVVEKREDGSVRVDTEPMTINQYHRYTNTTGLSEEEKIQFNEILDEIYQHPDDMSKLNDIQEQIDELKKDPNNVNVVQYLKNQQASLIRTVKKLPRHYQADETKLLGQPPIPRRETSVDE